MLVISSEMKKRLHRTFQVSLEFPENQVPGFLSVDRNLYTRRFRDQEENVALFRDFGVSVLHEQTSFEKTSLAKCRKRLGKKGFPRSFYSTETNKPGRRELSALFQSLKFPFVPE